MGSKVGLIYKLENIDAENGIDVFEIAPTLMQFGELVRFANNVLGYEQKIDVKIKPFKEGSWITEFVFQNTRIENLLNYLQGTQGQNVMILLTLLGLSVKDGIVGVAGIIRFTKGFVCNFKTNKNSTVTYYNEKDEKIEVSLEEHKLVQSPLIQNNYYNCTIAPLEKFPDVTAVSFKMDKEGVEEQRFTYADKEAFGEYAASELFGDAEDNTTNMNGLFIKPKRGSYSGTEGTYSFTMGETNISSATIEDEEFLNLLQTGEVRLYSEDVLKVDLKIHQTRNARNRISTSYTIIKVIDYIKYQKPNQININNLVENRVDKKD